MDVNSVSCSALKTARPIPPFCISKLGVTSVGFCDEAKKEGKDVRLIHLMGSILVMQFSWTSQA